MHFLHEKPPHITVNTPVSRFAEAFALLYTFYTLIPQALQAPQPQVL